jgi:glycosyltransferase involved in cell wall biosynthesis
MKVLWLASWFPNRTHDSTGDFIERQARALSPLLDELVIIFVCKDENLTAGEIDIVVEKNDAYTCYFGYYGGTKAGGIWQRYKSQLQYLRLQKELYNRAYPGTQKPDLVHVHVAMRAGMMALHLLQKKGIPYLVSEHWSGYFKQSLHHLYNSGFWYRWCNKLVLKKCRLLIPVSQHLGRQITTHFAKLPYQVVPNVVDTRLFHYTAVTQAGFTFLHPSYLDYSKNVEGMLQAAAILQNEQVTFKIRFVGAIPARHIALAQALGVLQQTVFFEDKIAYNQVAKLMQQCNALLMFSRYENLPCIILESLCSGRPVVCSRVGGIPEVVNQQNGIMVAPGDIPALAAAMKKMILGEFETDAKQFAADAAANYSYPCVAQKLRAIYEQQLQQA